MNLMEQCLGPLRDHHLMNPTNQAVLNLQGLKHKSPVIQKLNAEIKKSITRNTRFSLLVHDRVLCFTF